VIHGGGRRLRILARLAEGGDGATNHLCMVCAEVTGMTGAGIMLMSGDVHRGSVCTSSKVSDLIEQLQYSLGEGPCVDAYDCDRPVLEPDLVDASQRQWPAFAGPAIDAGVQAVFAFPLRVGAVRLGALNLHRDRVGPLTDEQHADALVMADVAAQAILVLQGGAPPGHLAAELEASADFQFEVHQAAGMVAAQLETSVAQALIRLRGHAFGHDRTLRDLAHDVVARKLRFEGPADENGP